MTTTINNPITAELAALRTIPSRMIAYGTIAAQITAYNNMVDSAEDGMNAELAIARIKYPMMAAFERMSKQESSINGSVPAPSGGTTFNNAMKVYTDMKGVLDDIYDDFDAALDAFAALYPIWTPGVNPPFVPTALTNAAVSAINGLINSATSGYASAIDQIQQTAFDSFAVAPMSEAMQDVMAPITSTPAKDKVVQDMRNMAGARITAATLVPKRSAPDGESLESNTIYPSAPKSGVSPSALNAFQAVALAQRNNLDVALQNAQTQQQVCLDWKVANDYDEVRDFAEANPGNEAAQEAYAILKDEFNSTVLADYNLLYSQWETLDKAYNELLNNFYDAQV